MTLALALAVAASGMASAQDGPSRARWCWSSADAYLCDKIWIAPALWPTPQRMVASTPL